MDGLAAARGRAGRAARQELAAAQERAALAARVEALHVGLQPQGRLGRAAGGDRPADGLLGSVAALVAVRAGVRDGGGGRVRSGGRRRRRAGHGRGGRRVRPPQDARISAGPGCCWADLTADADPEDAHEAGRRCRPARGTPSTSSRCQPSCDRPYGGCCARWRVVEDLAAAQALVDAMPEVVGGDPGRRRAERALRLGRVLGPAQPDRGPGGHRRRRGRGWPRPTTPASGCGSRRPSWRSRHRAAAQAVEVTLARLHESDAAMAAVAEELGAAERHRPVGSRRGGPAAAARSGRGRGGPGPRPAGSGRARAPAGPGQRDRRGGRAGPGRTGSARRGGAAGPGGGDGCPAGAAHPGGAGPGVGGPGRRAAPGRRERSGRPGRGRWLAGSGCVGRRRRPRPCTRPPASWPAGRALLGRGRRRAGGSARRRGPRPTAALGAARATGPDADRRLRVAGGHRAPRRDGPRRAADAGRGADREGA